MKNKPMTGDELLALFEALANPHRLRIIAILADGKQYVSQLAREAGMSRPLLYMHLQKMEKAGIVKTEMKISEDGKAMKFYELLPFEFRITPELIREAAKTLTIKKKEGN